MKANKGSPGVDGRTVGGITDYLKEHWPAIREQQAQQYIAEGHGWCVDLDREKFFDRVHPDKRMGQIAQRIEDKRLVKLIRALLKARGDGERVGQPERGRDSPRRSPFATAQ